MNTELEVPQKSKVRALHVFSMEDHDDAFYHWSQLKLEAKTLIHFDAHLDFDFISKNPSDLLRQNDLKALDEMRRKHKSWNLLSKPLEHQINVGNYIQQAIRAGIVSEFVWVYPDGKAFDEQRDALIEMFRNLMASPWGEASISEEPDRGVFSGHIDHCPFLAIPFSKLDRLENAKGCLLDIDLDFFLTRDISNSWYPYASPHEIHMWLSAESFLHRIFSQGIESECLTMAYSVEEGYVPLLAKFIGDELMMKLAGKSLVKKEMDSFKLLHESLERYGNPFDWTLLEDQFVDMVRSNSRYAPLFFHLSMIQLEQKKYEEARINYLEAIQLDASYRTKYNHPGSVLAAKGNYGKAEMWIQKMQKLDDSHREYMIMRVELACQKRVWPKAIILGEKLVSSGVEDSALRYFLALAYFKINDLDRSREHLRYYKEFQTRFDRESHFLRAEIARRRRERDDAIQNYQKYVLAGPADAKVYYWLMRLYFEKGNMYKVKRNVKRLLMTVFLRPLYALSHEINLWRIQYDFWKKRRAAL